MKTKFIISINDGYVEYAMAIEVDDRASISTVANKIRRALDNPEIPLADDSTLVCRCGVDYLNMLKSNLPQ